MSSAGRERSPSISRPRIGQRLLGAQLAGCRGEVATSYRSALMWYDTLEAKGVRCAARQRGIRSRRVGEVAAS
eukprot:scaffold262378_cov28-Tisochrysis_lutea.AAC.7